MADKYVCTLSEASLKKAKKELNEDPKERMSQVETFRTWIQQQPHLKGPTGTEFLLRFLRHCKFSQLRARGMYEDNLKMRSDNPAWFKEVDFSHPMLVKFLKEGYYLPMSQPDKDGRKVLVMRPGSFTADSKVYDRDIILRGMLALNSYIMVEEDTMVNGVIMLLDLTGFSMKHQTFWGMDVMTKTTKMWQNKMPGRMKGFHYYNIGPIFEGLMALMRPLLSKKFQDRIVMHGNNMESVYKVIPMECLPREYLPDDYKGPCEGTADDIVEKMLADLRKPNIRDRILHETSSQWGYDASKKPSEIPNESFRKLNVD